MVSHILPVESVALAQIPEPEVLRALAAFRSPKAHAVSFLYSLHSFPDRSHRTEKVAIGKLVQDQIAKSPTEETSELLSRDLNAILALSEEIQHTPTRWRAVYACSEEKILRRFNLPASEEIALLDVSTRFRLVPLLAAFQSCRPYKVVLMESGKTRLFQIRGSDIQEIFGKLSETDLTRRSEDSRVGWSKHLEGNVGHQERTWFRQIVEELRKLPGEQGPGTLVVGCRNDIWGEARTYFAELEENTIMGKFPLTRFEMGALEVLKRARSICEEYQRDLCRSLLHAIDEDNGRGTYGLLGVLKALAAGRVRKMLLGDMTGESARECSECGGIQPFGRGACTFCRGSRLTDIPADEALLRLALAQKAEILFFPAGTEETFHGAAALLRY